MNIDKLVKDITSPKNLAIVVTSVAIGWLLHSLLTGTPVLGSVRPVPVVQPVYARGVPRGRGLGVEVPSRPGVWNLTVPVY